MNFPWQLFLVKNLTKTWSFFQPGCKVSLLRLIVLEQEIYKPFTSLFSDLAMPYLMGNGSSNKQFSIDPSLDWED